MALWLQQTVAKYFIIVKKKQHPIYYLIKNGIQYIYRRLDLWVSQSLSAVKEEIT